MRDTKNPIFKIYLLTRKLSDMTVIKVVELLSNSKKNWEDATSTAIKRASKSIDNIRSANVSNMSVTVKNGKINEYRVALKVTFEVGS